MRKRVEAACQASGVCKLIKEHWWGWEQLYGFQIVRHNCFSPRTSATPHHGSHCQASSLFSVRSLILFLLPTQFPSGKFVICTVGMKSRYGVGSTDLSEDFYFCWPSGQHQEASWSGAQTKPLGDEAAHPTLQRLLSGIAGNERNGGVLVTLERKMEEAARSRR